MKSDPVCMYTAVCAASWPVLNPAYHGLKDVLVLPGVPWKRLRSFKSFVWASIVSASLLTIDRKQLL